MIEIRRLSDAVAVAGQVRPADLADIVGAGYRSLVCNRPDGEAPDQPAYREVAEAAGRLGLEVRYLPVVSGRMSAEDATAFAGLLRELPAPVLAYCRSGARSGQLWALAAEIGGAGKTG